MSTQYFVVRLSAKPREIHGPQEASVVIENLKSGDFSWTDIIWAPGSSENWVRLYDAPFLRKHMESMPPLDKLENYSQKCIEMLRPLNIDPVGRATYAPVPSEGFEHQFPKLKEPVFVQAQGVEHGPFTMEETLQFLRKYHSQEPVYIWHGNLTRMHHLEEIPEFSSVEVEGRNESRSANFINAVYSKELRVSSRFEIPATIRKINDDGSTAFGICIDVSMSGMQVSLDESFRSNLGDALAVGKELSLEMIPLSRITLPPFTFRAKVIRFVPETLRIGLRITGISSEDHRNLNECLAEIGREKFNKSKLK